MYTASISMIVFVCTFGAALAGISLRGILPDDHLSAESRDTVKLGIGLIGTMTALVLSLVTASAMSSFNALDTEVKHAAADILSLDRVLAQYGPETSKIRGEFKRALKNRIDVIWPRGNSRLTRVDPSDAARGFESLAAQIRGLTPQTD